MTASPGEIKRTLWQWQTNDFEAEPLFPSPKLELRARFVQRSLCNQGSHQTLSLAILPAFFRLAASGNTLIIRERKFFLQLSESTAAAGESHICVHCGVSDTGAKEMIQPLE
jgi:hypothetical protein